MGTFRTKVLALCPIVVSDFGDGQVQSTPLFWVNYEEAAPHLAKLSLMASNLNNASEISADDYSTRLNIAERLSNQESPRQDHRADG